MFLGQGIRRLSWPNQVKARPGQGFLVAGVRKALAGRDADSKVDILETLGCHGHPPMRDLQPSGVRLRLAPLFKPSEAAALPATREPGPVSGFPLICGSYPCCDQKTTRF